MPHAHNSVPSHFCMPDSDPHPEIRLTRPPRSIADSLSGAVLAIGAVLLYASYELSHPRHVWDSTQMFTTEIQVSEQTTRVQVNDLPTVLTDDSRPTDAPLPDNKTYKLGGVLTFERAFPGRKGYELPRASIQQYGLTERQRDRASAEHAVALRMWIAPEQLTLSPRTEYEWPADPTPGLREPGPLPVAAIGPGVDGVKPVPQGVIDRALPALARWVEEQTGDKEFADGLRAGGTPRPIPASLASPRAARGCAAAGAFFAGVAILLIVRAMLRALRGTHRAFESDARFPPPDHAP